MIYLFTGIESFTWQVSDFLKACAFCKSVGIDGLFVKVFDGMQGEWYSGNFPNIYQAIKGSGLDCIPYGFHYGFDKGSDLNGEADLAVKYGKTYGAYIADLEGSWDGEDAWALQLASTIALGQSNKPFKFYVSTWANPRDHGWIANIKVLQSIVTSFLPQAYDDYLYSAMRVQWPAASPISPTFHLTQDTGINSVLDLVDDYILGSTPDMSLWEYQYAIANPTLVKSIVSLVKGVKPMLVTNKGAVLDLRQSFQLETGESQDLCGPWSVAELKYAGLPGKGSSWKAEDVDVYADYLADKFMPGGHVSGQGSSIDNMHSYLQEAGLHWFDMNVSPTTTQASDLAHIRGALAAGYPVLVTVNELSVMSKTLGKIPYPWQPAMGPANHIFTVVGVDSAGDLICCDELNNQEPWPMVYKSANIECHWASIVQVVGPDAAHPWLAPIPSAEPASWPAGFTAQLFINAAPAIDYVQQEADQMWEMFYDQLEALLNAMTEYLGVPHQALTRPTKGTGIYKDWLARYKTKGQNLGPVLTFEVKGMNWSGQPIAIQQFAHARAEWNYITNTCHWYTATGGLV